MTLDKMEAAAAEARRFLGAVAAVQEAVLDVRLSAPFGNFINPPASMGGVSPILRGKLRRTSLDLTRTLADLRRPEGKAHD